jgi:hypothetical protein
MTQTPNVNHVTISRFEHLQWLIDNHMKSLFDIVKQNHAIWMPDVQKAYTAMLEDVRWRVMRDYCTVRVGLPQRSGLSAWAKRNMTEEDLFVGMSGDEGKAYTLASAPEGFVPRWIVIQDASVRATLVDSLYKTFGRDPKLQLFILLR